MPTIVVDVMPKAELLDPQGKAVAGAFTRLGDRRLRQCPDRQALRARPSTARSTKPLLASVRTIADEVLSNSVIEDVVGIEVVE